VEAWQPAANSASVILSVGALTGLFWRGRARRCYSLVVYLSLVVGQGLRVALADQPLSWPTWLVFEIILRAACASIAVEITIRMLRSLPQTWPALRRASGLVLAATLVLLLIDVPTASNPAFQEASRADIAAFEAARRWLPRLAYGSAWLFAVCLSVTTHAGLPLDPLHRTVLGSLAGYLLIYAVTLGALRADESYATVVRILQGGAFLCLLGLLSRAAWRHEPAARAPAEVVRRLQPWR
jgi:hypothetical protein